eukprot:c23353_g1_i1 orf=74-253(+)
MCAVGYQLIATFTATCAGRKLNAIRGGRHELHWMSHWRFYGAVSSSGGYVQSEGKTLVH